LRSIVTNRATDCNNFAPQLKKKNVFRKTSPTTRKKRKIARPKRSKGKIPPPQRPFNTPSVPKRAAPTPFFPPSQPQSAQTPFFPPTFARRNPQETKKRADEPPQRPADAFSLILLANVAAFAARKLDAFYLNLRNSTHSA